MAWPTSSVATTHLDEGSDNPALARGDLKQMADNVNAMQNMITMSGVSNDDLLVYSSAQGKFIPTSITSVQTNSNAPMAVLIPNSTVTNIGTGYSPNGSFYYWNIHFDESYDQDNLVSQDANGLMTFASGTYMWHFAGQKTGTPFSIFRPYSDVAGDYIESPNSTSPASNGYQSCNIDSNGVFNGFHSFTTSTYTKWAFQYNTESTFSGFTKLYNNPVFLYKIS